MSQALQVETYWDIVWRQFRKNRPAIISLWLLLPLFGVAIFGPLLASNLPFVYFTPEETYFPWFRGLFNPELSVDFFFNMAMIAFLPSLALAAVANSYWKGAGYDFKRRAARALVLYVGITLLLTLYFSPLLPALGIPNGRPTYPYTQTVFRHDEFVAREKAAPGEAPAEWGLYAPLPFGPSETDLEANNEAPLYRLPADKWRETNDGHRHWLGTDKSGVDVLTQMIYGTRVAMTVGFVAVVIYITIGVFFGALAGYFGGWVDMLISRAIEVMLLFPAFFLILTIVGLLGPSIYIIMVVIGITSWPSVARLVRGEVLKQRAIEYVLAAKAQGVSDGRIIFRQVLPNSLSPVLVTIPFGISGAIITEAGLSLLGWGVRPPAPTWGILLSQGRQNMEYWWLIVIPSLAIFFTVTVFNLVGSGLRDAMDPRLRR